MAHIFQLSVSANGGVPKRAVREVVVNTYGIVGNAVANPKIHGSPSAALCLYSLEKILALQAEGHPIFPGSVGENITVVGLDWTQVVPGAQLRLGADVLIEVTRYTTPCNTIVASFKDGDSTRILQTKHAGWARVYARVLQTGKVRVGDAVALQA